MEEVAPALSEHNASSSFVQNPEAPVQACNDEPLRQKSMTVESGSFARALMEKNLHEVNSHYSTKQSEQPRRLTNNSNQQSNRGREFTAQPLDLNNRSRQSSTRNNN